ncbi:MAG TPA: bifunctional riboflavin kinase/FAD synthetase [Candidatus Acidoferrum sp.]|jgi:phosphoribosyl 1,2-cyclic phosphate phosphodiesterase|nr:bifunctional riboflavin kinase/FAD synthetase [Candidatus Acidoferrum sp.]
MSLVPLKITVLGSGTSMGVPTLGCHCRVCSSPDPRDNRLRPSLLLSRSGQNVVIDTTPDFRQQALRAGIERLDAVLLTHGHADHVMGFDDIRPYNIRQRAALPVYSNAETFQILRRAFAYIFDGKPKLSSIPSVTLHEVHSPFELLGLTLTPVPLKHGDMDVLGFRFGRAAYLTDFSSIPNSSLALLSGLDVLILDALRDVPHPMHQTVEQALALIQQLKPRTAWFTHIAHDLPHAETNERLRKLGHSKVQLAYDGLVLEVGVEESAIGNATSRSATSELVAPSVFSSSQDWAARYAPSGRGSALAIGNFDGIHLGHQAILRAAITRARESAATPTVLTFDPPPQKVLRPESAPLRLTTIEQRIACFGALNIEAAVILPFTHELARLSPQEFVDQILVRDLHVSAVFVGENFRFGHKQTGDATLLLQLGRERGFEVVVIPHVVYKGEVVSSTIIRREIADGDVARAARLLGRPFVLSGGIVPGTGTGARFTFPTLNLATEQELLPARGVYVTRMRFEGESRSRRSVTNIGVRPTFNGSSLSVETHVLEPIGEASPARVELHFWKRLREEKKFSGPEELRKQIARDIAIANNFFSRLRRFRSSRISV